ncbi:MFS transporter [Fusarium albosuccineum]|uniref:MFS transporter n=1 Tax=Fusarium albosuccineum TaxID=1237068 RepID=A0A8H4PKY6_9HYPO|nr:MFS transporter [Fusarium albosuccineum]
MAGLARSPKETLGESSVSSDKVPRSEEIENIDEGLTDEDKAKIDRALLWKLDRNLIPWLTLLYLASFLDRTNVGNAKIEGMQEDLNMTDDQYNLGLAVFFLVYAILEPLTNVLLKRMKPSVFIPTITVLWGVCKSTIGLTHNFAGFLAARAFLGLTEGGLYPAVIYFLSVYAFSLFVPTIIKEMAQLLGVPPYAVSALTSITVGYIADRTRARGIYNIVMASIAAAGFSMQLAAQTAQVRRRVYKRGLSLGIMVMWNNLNGIGSSNVYRGQDAPNFRTGHGVVLGYIVVLLLGGSLLQTLVLRWENRKRRNGEHDSRIAGPSEFQLHLLGDKRPDFFYTT